MLYSQEAVRANIRNREGKRVFYLGKGDQLTSDARDFLNRERIAILPAEQAKPQRWKLLGGGYMEEKPENMTHLNGDTLVPKTHPRIAFRGKMDTLEAELLLCQAQVHHLREPLGEILSLARELLRCEILEEPVKLRGLCGLTEDQLRKRSHFPQDYYGQPHFMPQNADGMDILRLNRVRCAVRELELTAQGALPDRGDILQALNRMSSMVYLLMIQEKAKSHKNDQ